MSIYNPPSKTQGVFNPSNYGGLGAGGEITIDYLKSSFLEFPVAQGNATLVGTSVLGDITQQGDLSITGDLLVNDVNVITEIGTKQNELTAGTNISIVDDEVSCDLTGSDNIDITDGIISATGLATTDELDAKQDILTNFEINGKVNLKTSGTNFDTIVVRRPTNTTGLKDDYVIELNELHIWVNDANIMLENASSLISSVVSW